MLKDCEISTHSRFLSPTLNPEATPTTHALPTSRGRRGQWHLHQPSGSQADGRVPRQRGGAYLIALPHSGGVSAGVQSLESKEVKLRVRVVSDFMDDLLGRKRLRQDSRLQEPSF